MSDAEQNPWVIQPREISRIPAFVSKSWLASFRNSDWAGPVPNNMFDVVYNAAIRQLLERGAQVLVACNPDAPDHVLGWICYERTRDGKPVVHYMYTKSLFRRRGVARSLLAAAGIDPKERFFYTFRTERARLFPGGRYVREIACRKTA